MLHVLEIGQWDCNTDIQLLLGLLARGLSEIGPRGGLEGWRWIMIIEGLLVSPRQRQIPT